MSRIRFLCLLAALLTPGRIVPVAHAEGSSAAEAVRSVRRICDVLGRWPPSRIDLIDRIGARGNETDRHSYYFEWPRTPFSRGRTSELFPGIGHPDVLAWGERVTGRKDPPWWFVDLMLREDRRPAVAALARALSATTLFVGNERHDAGRSLWFSWAMPGKQGGRCLVEVVADKQSADLDRALVLGFEKVSIVPYGEDEFARLEKLTRYEPGSRAAAP